MGLFDRWRKPPAYEGVLADAVRVRMRRVAERTALFETTDAAELATLSDALRTVEGSGAMCLCPGSLHLDIETRAGSKLVTLHHGESLRWDGSHGNVPLASPDALMDWLSARGVGFVREEYEEARLRAVESDAEDAKWKAALPASLRPFFDDMRPGLPQEDPAWTAAIEAEFPDPVARARVLLELYGSGAGPWSGYPGYESIPAQWLLAMPLPVLLEAIGDVPGVRLAEGAARLFCSWDFGQRRKRDRTRIPDGLKRALVEHVERTGDEDKRFAARNALGS
ncbi:MAG TPA: hypothetical protein VFQ53_04395 [Kofleriaceae bacterium]|nr:hypothetical protein [Kofleriaceae bacterium]